jgi:hypothetical protein
MCKILVPRELLEDVDIDDRFTLCVLWNANSTTVLAHRHYVHWIHPLNTFSVSRHPSQYPTEHFVEHLLAPTQ